MTWIRLNGASGSGKTTIVRNLSFKLNGLPRYLTENDKKILKKFETHYSFLLNQFCGCRAVYIQSSFDPNKFFTIKSLLSKKIALVTSIDKYKSNLSQGESQRFILLEALELQPDLLILDESLSGLPEDHELSVLQAIKDLYENLNLLYISHRNNSEIERLFSESIDL
jgi:ABC-type dipeptide/oligopeptide/nickel transport system ATPase subunit